VAAPTSRCQRSFRIADGGAWSAPGSAADDTQSSGGLSGAVDSRIAVRRGDETAHQAPPVTRKMS